MRKLLLFVLALFGILSVQSFTWNYGYGENILPRGNKESKDNYSPPNYYLFIMNPNANEYELIDMRTTDFIRAFERKMCIKSEVCEIISKRSYSAIVISEDNKIFTATHDTYYNGTAETVGKRAMENCKEGRESYEKNIMGNWVKKEKCKLIMIITPDFKLQDKRKGETFDLKVTGSLTNKLENCKELQK